MLREFTFDDRSKDVIGPDGNKVGTVIRVESGAAYVLLDADEPGPFDAELHGVEDDAGESGYYGVSDPEPFDVEGRVFVLDESDVDEIIGGEIRLHRWPP